MESPVVLEMKGKSTLLRKVGYQLVSGSECLFKQLHRCSKNFHFPHVVVLCVQTTDDVIVGQTREKVNEFVYDYSYWSLDPSYPHFVPQEQVHTFTRCLHD